MQKLKKKILDVLSSLYRTCNTPLSQYTLEKDQGLQLWLWLALLLSLSFLD